MIARRPLISSPLEAALIEEAEQLERALAADTRHQRLNIIRHTLEQLAALRKAEAQANGAHRNGAHREASSVLHGAELALEDKGEPLSLAELMETLPAYGKTPGGDKPAWNLSSQLSGAKARFERVDWKGEKRWWIAGKEVPK